MSSTRPWPEVLDLISSKIGKSRDLVQGPGGNTSWKRNEQMWVKASGKKLGNALEEEIFCKVEINSPNLVSNSGALRPSIETSLHAVRKESFVVHVHSVGAMSLGFRKAFNRQVMTLLRQYSLGIVDYYRPGIDLSNALHVVTTSKTGLKGSLLKNHGLVLWGEDLQELYETLLNFEEQLLEMYPINDEVLQKIKSQSLKHYLNNQYLTPDHAVFGPSMDKLATTDKESWLNDLNYALEKSVACVESIDIINFINLDEVNALQKWDSEKLRLGMNN
jgi:rhamnose utilization protein RhaD (predicted bifunctional aldolase and dehydrogenase)